MAERTCIVTRAVRDPDELIRFVAGPDGAVVPDVSRKLPGRGVWVSADRSTVEEAVGKRLFSRGLKRSVQAEADLPALVDTLLEDRALGALGFARKAGQCVNGQSKVETALAHNKAISLLHATDGAADGLRKLENTRFAAAAAGLNKPPLFRIFTEAQMSLALGATNVIHAALVRGGAANACLRHLKKLAAYRDAQPSLDTSTSPDTGSDEVNCEISAQNLGPSGKPGR